MLTGKTKQNMSPDQIQFVTSEVDDAGAMV